MSATWALQMAAAAVPRAATNVSQCFAASTIRKLFLLSSPNPSFQSTEKQSGVVLQHTGSSWIADILSSLMVLEFKHSFNPAWKVPFAKNIPGKLLQVVSLFLSIILCLSECVFVGNKDKTHRVYFWAVFLWITQVIKSCGDFGGCLSSPFQTRLLQLSMQNEFK